MKWLAFLAALICCTLFIAPDVHAQQCFGGSCYGPHVMYSQPVYAPQVFIVERPTTPNREPSPGDHAGVPLEQTVIVATPDPRFSHCDPHACFRPQFEPRPFNAPHCPPQNGFLQHKRSVGIGLNLSWNSRRSWRY